MNWTVYILECNDNSLYTGITNNLERRITQHETGKGAKYTRSRGPFRIVYTESFSGRGDASRREYEIKQLPKQEKLKLTN